MATRGLLDEVRRGGAGLPAWLWAALSAVAGCALPGPVPLPEVTFDTAVAWVRHDADSTRILVEVAASQSQQEVGLAGRAFLDPQWGMLFQFDEPRSGDDGFWMWRTRVPLDVAFIDGSGVIRRILSMDPCAAVSQGACPEYYPGVAYVAALEVNRGWFAANGIAVGASVRLGR
jgi:uncharacterized membrane protein (UPF0127 family)